MEWRNDTTGIEKIDLTLQSLIMLLVYIISIGMNGYIKLAIYIVVSVYVGKVIIYTGIDLVGLKFKKLITKYFQMKTELANFGRKKR